MRNKCGSLLLGAAFLLGSPRPPVACGLTPPIGPNGLPTVCHGDANGWRFRAGLVFGGAFGLFERFDVLVELALLGKRRLTLGAGYLF